MLSLRKLRLCLGILTAILAMSNFAVAQDASVRKELEALYAKRDKAIKEKDVAAFRSTETKDFEVIEGGSDYAILDVTISGAPLTGERANALAEEAMKDVKDVKSFTTRIERIEPGKDPKQMIVTSIEYGQMSSKEDAMVSESAALVWEAISRDLWISTQDGWKIKRHQFQQFGKAPDQKPAGLVEVQDKQVWEDLKALYAKLSKPFETGDLADLALIKSIETEDYSEESSEGTRNRQKANAEHEKIVKEQGGGTPAAIVFRIWQGDNKNELIVEIDRCFGSAFEQALDVWTRTPNGWKLKHRKCYQ